MSDWVVEPSFVAGLVFFVVGLLLSAYFWFNPRQIKGKLRYKFSSADRHLDRLWAARPTNIYLDIWNPSNAGVDAGDIREPLKVSATSDILVADVQVIDTFGGLDATRVAIDVQENREFSVRWEFLDPGMGFQLSILVEPPEQHKFSLRLGRPFRSRGRGWLDISGRFKDFSLREPLDLDDFPAIGKAGYIIVSVGVVVIFLHMVALDAMESGRLPVDLTSNNVVQAISIIVINAISWTAAAGFQSLLYEVFKRVFNTRSPFDRLNAGRKALAV